MASIHREIEIGAQPQAVWDAVRDVGAVHRRLAPGFVTDVKMDGDARIVTFGNGMVARELIVDVDDTARRLVWAVVGGRLSTTTPRCRSSPATPAEAGSCGSPTCCRTRWPAPLPA
jgi:hypothetical protein